MNPLLATCIGAVLGYVAGDIVGHPRIGAAAGAAAGYFMGGGKLPQLSSGNDVLQVPNTTITSGQ